MPFLSRPFWDLQVELIQRPRQHLPAFGFLFPFSGSVSLVSWLQPPQTIVKFNHIIQYIHRIPFAHHCPDFMHQPKSSIVPGQSYLPFEFKTGKTLFGRRHEDKRQHPGMELNLTVFHYRSAFQRTSPSALAAFNGFVPLNQ